MKAKTPSAAKGELMLAEYRLKSAAITLKKAEYAFKNALWYFFQASEAAGKLRRKASR